MAARASSSTFGNSLMSNEVMFVHAAAIAFIPSSSSISNIYHITMRLYIYKRRIKDTGDSLAHFQI